jgi:hypothetical protein
MESLRPKKINQSQWKKGLTLKRDISSLKNVRLMLKLRRFFEGNQAKRTEENNA